MVLRQRKKSGELLSFELCASLTCEALAELETKITLGFAQVVCRKSLMMC